MEARLPVDQIKANGIDIWPLLRVYMASRIVFDHDRTVALDSKIIRSAFRNFFHGFSNFFKPCEYLFLTSSDQGKKSGGKYIDRPDILSELLPGVLVVELPSNGRQIPRKLRSNQKVVSKFPFYLAVRLMALFTFSLRLEGEEVIRVISRESGITDPYKKRIRIFLAERRVMSAFITWKKPRALFLTTPYTNFGYVFAFKERGLKVVEFQHGSISSGHYAYNLPVKADNRLLPDKLLTFGRKEAGVFTSGNHYISGENVHAVGSFIIDAMLQNPPGDERFRAASAAYSKRVAYAAQDALENQFVPFLREAAGMDSSIAYILIPRSKPAEYYAQFNFPANVIYIPWLNTYELIYLCDIHSTINSTTALEAPSLGRINILLNIENRAKDYFENVLPASVNRYAENPAEYVEMIRQTTIKDQREIVSMNNDIIVSGFRQNLACLLPEILAD